MLTNRAAVMLPLSAALKPDVTSLAVANPNRKRRTTLSDYQKRGDLPAEVKALQK